MLLKQTRLPVTLTLIGHALALKVPSANQIAVFVVAPPLTNYTRAPLAKPTASPETRAQQEKLNTGKLHSSGKSQFGRSASILLILTG